jgi:hypothetical protein
MLIGSMIVESLPVFWPILAVLGTVLLFIRGLRSRSSQVNALELGVLYVSLVSLYAVVPFLSYLMGGLSFSPVSDFRLFQAQPSPTEMASVLWYYFLYLCAFCLAYLHVRQSIKPSFLRLLPPSRRLFSVLFASLVAIKLFFLLVNVVYRLEKADSYEESYLMYRGLPQVLQQVLNHLNGMVFTLEILIMVFLVMNFRKYKVWILGWIGFQVASLFVTGVGSRTELLVILLAFAVSHHYFVRPITVRVALAVGAVALLVFMFLGMVRGLRELNADNGVNPFGYANEFEIVLGNAYDMSQLRSSGEAKSIFPGFYLSDFLNLVPQQLLPFKKIDLAYWYVNGFYPEFAEGGGGLAFGAIPESMLGLGWVDAVWRGALVGAAFAWLHRRVFRVKQSIWSFGFYVWALVFSYQCFRGTTFILVPRAFYQFFLLFLLVKFSLYTLEVLQTGNSPAAVSC